MFKAKNEFRIPRADLLLGYRAYSHFTSHVSVVVCELAVSNMTAVNRYFEVSKN
jgi:hypothetical protein